MAMSRGLAMAEERACAHCGAGFQVNGAARNTHRCCVKARCQRERRRLAQRARRRDGRAASAATPVREQARPSKAWLKRRAAYMRTYRKRRPAYRERERERLRQGRLRRRGAEASSGVVTEAGLSNHEPAMVYLVTGPKSEVRLRAVTATGRSVMLSVETATEAGSRALTSETRSRAAGDVVTEAG